MKECIFCKIVKGEIPCHKIYEDKDVFVFLDKNQYVEGHVMIIPKKHSRWLWDMKKEDYLTLEAGAYKIANAIRKAFNTEWVEEVVAGMGVPHVHIHLLQRQDNDGIGEIPVKNMEPQPTEEERKEFVKKIQKFL